MKLRVLGVILLLASLCFYFFKIFQFTGSDFILGIISAIALGLILGFFSKKK